MTTSIATECDAGAARSAIVDIRPLLRLARHIEQGRVIAGGSRDAEQRGLTVIVPADIHALNLSPIVVHLPFILLRSACVEPPGCDEDLMTNVVNTVTARIGDCTLLFARDIGVRLRESYVHSMAARDPLVSVVIPAFNAASTLQETLESVARQTYTHLDVIVVDDGSTDETAAIAENHCATDPRFRVISKPNGGVASARNAGIREARGPFVAFSDADDLWHPTKIAKQLDALLSAGSETALVYSPFRLIDSNGRVLASPHKYGVSGWVIHRHFFTNLVGNGSAMLVRKDVLEEFGGFDPVLRNRGAEGCEDLLLQLRIAARYRFGEVSEYLVGYRRRPDSMSANAEQMIRSGILAVKTAMSECIAVPGLSARAMLKRYEWQRLKATVRKARVLDSVHLLVVLLLTSPFFVVGEIGAEAASLTTKLGRAIAIWRARQSGVVQQPPHFYDLDPWTGIDFRHNTATSRALRRLARFDRAYRPATNAAVVRPASCSDGQPGASPGLNPRKFESGYFQEG